MNLNINKDNYDTELLGVDTYKIFLNDNNFNFKKIDTFLKGLNKGNIVFSIISFSHSLIEYMQKKDFLFKSIRSYYKLNLKKHINIIDNYSDIFFIDDKNKFKFEKLNIGLLSNTIGETSRFFHDKLISKEHSELFYNNWVSNILSKKYGDGGFVLIKNKKLVGIINLIIKNEIGYIDLLGIITINQGKGYGKKLLLKGINFLISRKVKEIFVITEGENINANNFYQKNNFTLDKIELVYHKHI